MFGGIKNYLYLCIDKTNNDKNNMRKVFTIAFFCLSLGSTINAKGSGDRIITHCTVTSYNAVKSQTDDSPNITADGTRLNHEKVKNGTQRIAAISRNLLWLIPYGSIIEVEGYGIFEVRDTMNKRYKHCVDILQHSSKPNFKEENVKITVIRKGEKKNS